MSVPQGDCHVQLLAVVCEQSTNRRGRFLQCHGTIGLPGGDAPNVYSTADALARRLPETKMKALGIAIRAGIARCAEAEEAEVASHIALIACAGFKTLGLFFGADREPIGSRR
ncbi:hypothetical protein JM946_13760 [Steroidobacter sp. S1-65]|uniref:Uncharacterized protein n=1 Tax=Steroidobacter gossypii TaxID=2805490 RepID=A0ABS1WXU7_9GAMM|nr:hypothetical protein [Steroidobacter gossypii]MBM0105802.1 hypothetical protein [Steroidobacter gossypii]